MSTSGTTRAAGRSRGVGRVLVLVYAILALGATGRSVFQILTKFDEAPLAYVLSAVAAVVYIVATIALLAPGRIWRAIAWTAISFEMTGVLVVGVLSLALPQWFAHPSVWSGFGIGYLFIPLVLPVLGLAWLARTRGAAHERVTA
ncbi:hypothetical protein [Ruicaihuangia caeni]|uniref:Integral membrane protein n=1 Tax=Ruicaihuangia caeni TaxID=3042517 RepID=A0AAW6T5A1_9MICO|nr:hypothetical protein [Klugiella sp. YN-L-19]MDI2097519.1 hypothetical protein [Klugiella sp. YN-L-19]